ncbi:MAG TPA: leucine--tRNA ligase [Phaeodactylibacter sp.]|nr:leucine--tRNA ligase [Phaeodactylibacter sp.]
MEYQVREIEQKWKKYWVENQIYRVSNESERPKYYVLDMFPYPSGSGLHVGHPLGYIASDIYARYKRLKGFNVLHPMGYDAFGLPAEQYALQTGIHPAVSTARNIKRYREQLDNIGLSFDWSREVITSDPKYYKWTQWIFLQLFKHYYDPEEQKPKPVSELIAHFEQHGNANIAAHTSQKETFSAEQWNAMSPAEKDAVLMNYRLAYRQLTYVNWCEALGTVLSNDEVKDGVSERGGHPVVRKPMMQWLLRITAYAERLLNDLQELAWSDAMKKMQSNWIGRSEGAQIFFPLLNSKEKIEVFTTRPDTIFGATFMVLAPEHPLVKEITTEAQKAEVEKYLDYVNARSERERQAEKNVTGAFTGAYALNPLLPADDPRAKIPVWISEYVLPDYGTGAIMAVPGEDERDFRFAQHFGLPVIEVVDKSQYPDAQRGDKVGRMIHSDLLNGLEVKDAIPRIIEEIEKRGLGQKRITYKLRDAIFSRQRYWGEPFPIVYDSQGVAHPLNESELPLELPPLDDFKPASDGRSPLARLTDWVNLPNGYHRETDTMPGYAGSSWYFLRYMDPHNDQNFASPQALNYWRDVDLYVGGTEHATGHLLYSRFWHKFLHDLGYVPTKEPFKKLINQGMIQGVIEFACLQKEKVNGYSRFVCARLAKMEPEHEFAHIPIPIQFVKDYGTEDSYLDTESIEKFIQWRPEFKDAIFECANGIYHKGTFTPKNGAAGSHLFTHSETGKMSKRYHNVVNPDDVIERYGADCFRMYEMFLGPVEQSKPWSTKGIDGVYKFLRRFWQLFFDEQGQWAVTEEQPDKKELKALHATLKKVSEDIERFSFNTCVSAFMSLANELRALKTRKRAILEPLVIAMAPFAPHITEELWHRFGHESSVHLADFAAIDESYLVEDTLVYPISINGKRRAEAEFPAQADKATIEQEALKLEAIQKWIEGKPVKRVIVVPGRMVNIVV